MQRWGKINEKTFRDLGSVFVVELFVSCLHVIFLLLTWIYQRFNTTKVQKTLYSVIYLNSPQVKINLIDEYFNWVYQKEIKVILLRFSNFIQIYARYFNYWVCFIWCGAERLYFINSSSIIFIFFRKKGFINWFSKN